MSMRSMSERTMAIVTSMLFAVTSMACFAQTTIDGHREEDHQHPSGRLQISLTTNGLDTAGHEHDILRFEIEEFLSEQVNALLPMIFFDRGKDVLPDRYVRRTPAERTTFDENELFGSRPLDVYHELLNIVGARMRRKPASKITLTGCLMQDRIETCAGGLALRRAARVRDYLTQVWGIDRGRIAIRSRGLPERPSNPSSVDGQEENRRVGISSSASYLLDLVNVRDTIRVSDPPRLRIRPSVVHDTAIASWRLFITQGGIVLDVRRGTGEMPESFDWDPAALPMIYPRTDQPLEMIMEVEDVERRRATTQMLLPVDLVTVRQKRERTEGDMKIDEYGLILFGFGRSDAGGANKAIIDLITSRLAPTSNVTVTGHTDRTGSDEVNLRISTQRAETIGRAIGPRVIDTRGYGTRNALYTNDLPEGRFHNRTVRVHVETPIR